jgi:hypothetical protein
MSMEIVPPSWVYSMMADWSILVFQLGFIFRHHGRWNCMKGYPPDYNEDYPPVTRLRAGFVFSIRE